MLATASLHPEDAWALPDHLCQLRDTVRRFMAEEVRPIEDGLPHDAAGPPEDVLATLQAKARALGLWALSVPAERGGAGLSTLGQVIVAEEAAQCRMGAFFPALGAFGGNPPSVLYSATPEQFERYASPMIAGASDRPFTAVSEATGGSDPARAIRLRAERDGDHYVLNGTKMWTTHAGIARWGVVYARTGAAGTHKGITCFIVHTDVPGLTRRPIPVITSYPPYEMHFDNVRVPVADRIGAEGEGFRLAADFLVRTRIPYAAGPIGIAQRALHIAIDWARRRETFGVRLADRQAVQWMVVDSEIALRSARLLTWQAAWKADRGEDVRIEASIAKIQATETAFEVVDRCIQILGGVGLAREMPLERWLRDLRVKRLGEGASEVQKMMIARELLGREASSSTTAAANATATAA